ncbi:MAG: aminoacyl-tRNA hydrolase [Ignavibacteria bacterium]|nr:aminoacyl-tRNA hydrolase [Ignavibacteria bacterium]
MDLQELLITPTVSIPMGELEFRTSRSGGPGGQNVNKLETRVELRFDIAHSASLTEDQRQLLSSRLKSRIDADGILQVVSQESRSQWKNKQDAVNRFVRLLKEALKPRKVRLKTKPTRESQERRLEAKKRVSEKKKLRRNLNE